MPPLVQSATYLGSMLFSRAVSGTRIVARGGSKTIGGHTFAGYGAHVDDYGSTYLTAACAIGMEEEEIGTFVARLDKALVDFAKQAAKKQLEQQRQQKQGGSGSGSGGAAEPPAPPQPASAGGS